MKDWTVCKEFNKLNTRWQIHIATDFMSSKELKVCHHRAKVKLKTVDSYRVPNIHKIQNYEFMKIKVRHC